MEVPKQTLNTDAEMPVTGFGTWQLSNSEAAKAVSQALKTGYRLIDTAKIYGNEEGVGEAIRQSGLKREEVFLTTKLWPSDFDNAKEAFEQSLRRLNQPYLDLYLIHWPNGESRKEAWKSLTEIYQQGKAKAVGVSNYMVEHLNELFEYSELVPAVNQIEFHPFIYQRQKPVLELCKEKNIVVEAYSPLTVGRNLAHPQISAIAKAYDRSNAQIILRWCLQKGTVPIPRSSNPDHITENLAIFDFEIADKDISLIDKLSDNSGWHPNEM